MGLLLVLLLIAVLKAIRKQCCQTGIESIQTTLLLHLSTRKISILLPIQKFPGLPQKLTLYLQEELTRFSIRNFCKPTLKFQGRGLILDAQTNQKYSFSNQIFVTWNQRRCLKKILQTNFNIGLFWRQQNGSLIPVEPNFVAPGTLSRRNSSSSMFAHAHDYV